MDYKRREEIFSKDYITTQEIQELLGFKSQSQASQMIMQIKRVVGDKLGVKGKIHTEDYFAYFGVQPKDRYNQVTHDRELGETENQKYSPCSAKGKTWYENQIDRNNEVSDIREYHKQIFKKRGIIK
jgi:hypothetical protein